MKRKKIAIAAIFSVVILLICFILGVNALLTNLIDGTNIVCKGQSFSSVEEAIHGKERDFVNVIALSGNTPIEENIKIVDAFLEAKENLEDPVYKNRIDQIIEYEND